MKRFVSRSALWLALGLLLTAAPAWAGSDISGMWRGSWTCTKQPCAKSSGGMSAVLHQAGHDVTGNFTLTETVKGYLNCTLQKAVLASDDEFAGTMKCGAYSVGMAGKLNAGALEGEYDGGPLGMGTFKMNR